MEINMKVIISFLPELLKESKFEPHNTPPQVIYLLYSVLKDAGFDAEVIDPFNFYQFEGEEKLYEKCFEYIDCKISEDDIICFSSNSFNWGFTKIMTNMILNKYPDIKIVLGGLHPTIFDDYAMSVTNASVVIRSEGEKKLVEVIEALVNDDDLSDIIGITYRDGEEVIKNPDCGSLTIEELENSPLPDFSTLPKKAKYLDIPVETSRGCKFSCAFCSIPHRNNWRGISVEQLERRLKNVMKYKDNFSPVSRILFVDDCFTANQERAKAIAEKLKELNLNKKYFIEVRAMDVLKSDLFEKFDPDLISSMQVGVECGYDEGLRKIRKGLTISRLLEALEILVSKGFNSKIMLSFIIGFPWEGQEEINKTLDTIEHIATKFNIFCNLNWLLFLPSDLWKEKEKYNIHIDESIFDNPLWPNSKEVFDITHPLVTEEILKETKCRMDDMEARGLSARLNTPVFLNTVDIIR